MLGMEVHLPPSERCAFPLDDCLFIHLPACTMFAFLQLQK